MSTTTDTTTETTTDTTTTTTGGTDHGVTVGGLRLHVREVGTPSGSTVVVLHGVMGHAREWDTLTGLLAPRFGVIAVDQRGHGESAWADEYSVSLMAGDVVGVLDALGRERVHLVGHSMGGMVAMQVAARHPQRVGRLVLLDIGPDSVRPEVAAELAAGIEEMGRERYTRVDDAVAAWRQWNPLARESLLRHYVEHCLVRVDGDHLAWRFDARGAASFVRSVRPSELWDAVDGIVAPTLLVRGERSPHFDAEAATRVAQRLADGRVAVVPGAGHDLGVEAPESVAAAVAEFLG